MLLTPNLVMVISVIIGTIYQNAKRCELSSLILIISMRLSRSQSITSMPTSQTTMHMRRIIIERKSPLMMRMSTMRALSVLLMLKGGKLRLISRVRANGKVI